MTDADLLMLHHLLVRLRASGLAATKDKEIAAVQGRLRRLIMWRESHEDQ